jgi:hypothetical protein
LTLTKGTTMRRPIDDDFDARFLRTYEEAYGDADQGGWAPRARFEDFAERSRYSSQHDGQEDRSGFRRGFQGREELDEADVWASRHAHGDEDAAEAAPGPVFEEDAEEDESGLELARARQMIRDTRYPGGWIREF